MVAEQMGTWLHDHPLLHSLSPSSHGLNETSESLVASIFEVLSTYRGTRFTVYWLVEWEREVCLRVVKTGCSEALVLDERRTRS